MSESGIHELHDPPAEGQRVKHENVIYTTVKEGLAHILVPEESAKAGEGQGVQQVFYNPIQQFNRDLTVLAIKAYGKGRMQQKLAASRARVNKFAEKKRKRKEQAQTDRPAKSPRLSDDAAPESTDAPGSEMRDAAEAEEGTEKPADAEPTDTAEQQPVQNTAEAPEKKEPAPTFTILDALSASGLRALRYAHEIPFLTKVTANDILKAAAQAIERNAVHNKLLDKIHISVDDALAHMYQRIANELRRIALTTKGKPGPSDKYDVIDLDPYGSAAPFLDAAVQAVRDDGGLLCVTCTDSGVWASNGYPEKCYALYGGVPLKGWYSHEAGLRLILHAIETSAAKYGLAMEPLLSLSVDFYSRLFVRITKSPSMVKFQGGKNMVVYSCGGGCGSWTTQLLMRNKPAPNKKGSGIFYKHGFTKAPTAPQSCEHCGSAMHLAGPMYAGRIHSTEFIKSVIAEVEEASPDVYGTRQRIRGVLQTALEEFLASPEEMQADASENGDGTKRIKKSKTEAELAAIDPYPFSSTRPKWLGYRVTRSHCKAGSMKTDAPWSVIWHVFREWIRQRAPVKEENIKAGSIAYRLLGLGRKADATESGKKGTVENGKEEDKIPEVVFDEKLGRSTDETKFVRYQMNPRENWGPMNRAKGK
ncbi:hypothetical protein MMYC01_208703 [Madurella mycetomatis]|uniref:tRNA (guanine(26)-N(2))-dimethyltransferase n=1 Tax=Madurella mycetomatis TaxID=100816 RepID=A0A175VTD6_9PEZI|nr:hypothetical protein MMYC01_208703 [Madurella mycetomatis]